MAKYIILFISLLFGVAKNIISKAGGKECSGFNNLMKINMITAFLGIVVFLINGIDIALFTNTSFIILALVYGLCTLGSQSLYMIAVQLGSVSVCSLIYAACFIIPTLFTAIFYNEKFSLFRGIGIGLMLLSVLLVSSKGKKSTNNSKSYLIYAVLAMVCAGTVGILQKVFSRLYGGVGINEYLFLAFLFMFVFSAIGNFIVEFKNGTKYKRNSGFYIFSILLAVSIVVANKLNLFLVGTLSGLIFFPVINGGTIMLSALVSRFLFKEMLSPLGRCGIITDILSIFLIAL